MPRVWGRRLSPASPPGATRSSTAGLTQAQLDEMVKKALYFDPTLVRYTEPYGRQRCQEHGRQVPDDSDLRQSGGNGRGDKGLKVLVGSGADGSTCPHGTQALDFGHWSSDRA